MPPLVSVDFTDFLANLAAGLGLIKTPRLAYIATNTDAALQLIEQHGGPTPFVCANYKGAFFQNGIGRQTNSWSGHSGIHVSEKYGQIIRAKHPDLLKPRSLRGIFGPLEDALPPVPADPKAYEVIESQATVSLNSWPKTIHGDIQAVAFLRNWTDEQIDSILYDAYYYYGAPYDILEIGRDTGFWFLPKLQQIGVCSSRSACSLAKGDAEIGPWMKLHAQRKCIHECSPADLGRYLFSNPAYTPVVFRCDLAEARQKI